MGGWVRKYFVCLFASLFTSHSFRFHFFRCLECFARMRTKRKKTSFFRFKAKTKIPTFSLIFALSEYERRTLLRTDPGLSKDNTLTVSSSITLVGRSRKVLSPPPSPFEKPCTATYCPKVFIPQFAGVTQIYDTIYLRPLRRFSGTLLLAILFTDLFCYW
jgi:hypothetical protein